MNNQTYFEILRESKNSKALPKQKPNTTYPGLSKKRVHQEGATPAFNLVQLALATIKEFLAATEPNGTRLIAARSRSEAGESSRGREGNNRPAWNPPPVGKVKINVDVAMNNQGMACTAVAVVEPPAKISQAKAFSQQTKFEGDVPPQQVKPKGRAAGTKKAPAKKKEDVEVDEDMEPLRARLAAYNLDSSPDNSAVTRRRNMFWTMMDIKVILNFEALGNFSTHECMLVIGYMKCMLGVGLWLKREDLQPVFSFKFRGAYNMMAMLPKEQLERGVICSSAGNHAQGVALAAKRLGCNAVIVMPITTPEIKWKSVKRLPATVLLIGDSYDEAQEYAKMRARKEGQTFVSPFDHPDAIMGQGTVGMEIVRQIKDPVHAIFVPIGAGGLIAGIATYVKRVSPKVKVIGVEPSDANSMALSLHHGQRVMLDKVE
ncbi:hypothetical protein Drorol1_Dr00000307, partial [Drosera rotundifolia]